MKTAFRRWNRVQKWIILEDEAGNSGSNTWCKNWNITQDHIFVFVCTMLQHILTTIIILYEISLDFWKVENSLPWNLFYYILLRNNWTSLILEIRYRSGRTILPIWHDYSQILIISVHFVCQASIYHNSYYLLCVQKSQNLLLVQDYFIDLTAGLESYNYEILKAGKDAVLSSCERKSSPFASQINVFRSHSLHQSRVLNLSTVSLSNKCMQIYCHRIRLQGRPEPAHPPNAEQLSMLQTHHQLADWLNVDQLFADPALVWPFKSTQRNAI